MKPVITHHLHKMIDLNKPTSVDFIYHIKKPL